MVPQYWRATPTESWPFFDKAAFVKYQGAIGAAKVIVYKTTKLDNHVVFVPGRIAYETLHGPDIGVFDGQGDGFDGFTLQGAELSGHVIIEMLPGLAALETIGELLMKPSELI